MCDASSIINAFATGIAADLLAAYSVILAPIVAEEELLYVYTDDEKGSRRLIDMHFFAAEGLSTTTASLSESELELTVRYAEFVDDGEAQSLAIAKTRRLPILTDDIAGSKLAVREKIDLQTIIGLVKLWASDKEPADVRQVLQRIHSRGRYRPPASHPDYEWYVKARGIR